MRSDSQRLRFGRIAVVVTLSLIAAGCSGSASPPVTGAQEAGNSGGTAQPSIPADVLADLSSVIGALRVAETEAASAIGPPVPLSVDGWSAAMPWHLLEADFDAARITDDIHRATLGYLFGRPTSDAAARSTFVTGVPAAVRLGTSDFPSGVDEGVVGETSESFDAASGVARREMHASAGVSDEETGVSFRIQIDIVIEWHACWDPGQPQQRTASLDLSTMTVTEETGGEQVVHSKRFRATLTEYVGGGFNFETTSEFRDDESGVSGSITVADGGDPMGDPFEGNSRWTGEGEQARGEWPGGGSISVTCAGPSEPCWERVGTAAGDTASAVEFLSVLFDGEPGGEDFCLVPEVQPATASLLPGGDEIEVTLLMRNWNEEPIEGAEVKGRLTRQLGTLTPLEGGTDQEGIFRSTYTTADAGVEGALFDVEYSFFEQSDMVDLEIESPWKLQMTWTHRRNGDQVVWFYETDFGASEDGRLLGSGTGQINGFAHCISTSEGYSGPFFEFVGTFAFEIAGELADGIFDLEVTGSDAWLEWLETPSDPLCGEAFFDLVLDGLGAFTELPLHQLVGAGEILIPAQHGAVVVLDVTDLGTLRVGVLDNDQLDP